MKIATFRPILLFSFLFPITCGATTFSSIAKVFLAGVLISQTSQSQPTEVAGKCLINADFRSEICTVPVPCKFFDSTELTCAADAHAASTDESPIDTSSVADLTPFCTPLSCSEAQKKIISNNQTEPPVSKNKYFIGNIASALGLLYWYTQYAARSQTTDNKEEGADKQVQLYNGRARHAEKKKTEVTHINTALQMTSRMHPIADSSNKRSQSVKLIRTFNPQTEQGEHSTSLSPCLLRIGGQCDALWDITPDASGGYSIHGWCGLNQVGQGQDVSLFYFTEKYSSSGKLLSSKKVIVNCASEVDTGKLLQ